MTQQRVGAVPEFTIGDRLRKARETLDMEQSPFAELIGVSRGTVSNYERGTTQAYKPVVVRAWALATGVSLEWLERGITPGGPDGSSITTGQYAYSSQHEAYTAA